MVNCEFLIKLTDGMVQLTITYCDYHFPYAKQSGTEKYPGAICA